MDVGAFAINGSDKVFATCAIYFVLVLVLENRKI